jgi:hypothetical protein
MNAPTNNFNNPPSQAEKAALLKEQARALQEERTKNTRVAYQSVTDPEMGGRFARSMIEQVNGRGPTIEYPLCHRRRPGITTQWGLSRRLGIRCRT